MPRRFAGQVHKQASRFLRVNLLKREPAWYQPVLENPPLPLPPKAPPSRTTFDLPISSTSHSISRRPLPIRYVEDSLRRQFFRDHPFESFRPVSLTEGAHVRDEHPIHGRAWTRLRQHGRNPTPEDAIRYAVNLHEHHKVPLSDAYASAVAQFRSLRSERQVAANTALLEAETLGIQFGPSQVQVVFGMEEEALETWQKKDELDASALAARKRWKAIIEKNTNQETWSRGREYIRLWKEGIRPDYLPALSETVITPSGLKTGVQLAPENATPEQIERQKVAKSPDFMNLAGSMSKPQRTLSP